jgi:Cu+-exporting ATPase
VSPAVLDTRGAGRRFGMEIDPVCGMEVDPETAAGSFEHGGTTYYFCSLGCLEDFREDPARYLS